MRDRLQHGGADDFALTGVSPRLRVLSEY